MPTYRYRCDTCGDELEVWQSFQDAPLTVHEADGGRLRRVLSAAGIVLKGPGFYRNDSRSGSSSGSNGKRSDSEPSKSKESSDSKESAGSKDSKGSQDSKGSNDRATSSGDSKPASTSHSSSSSGD